MSCFTFTMPEGLKWRFPKLASTALTAWIGQKPVIHLFQSFLSGQLWPFVQQKTSMYKWKYYLTTRTLNKETVRNTSVKFKEMVVRKNLLKLLLSILSVTL